MTTSLARTAPIGFGKPGSDDRDELPNRGVLV